MNPGPWLSFAAPHWLAGLFAVLGPVAAHLWSRRLGPPRRFPAVRLMVEARRERRRATRLNDLTLLMLRCLAVALIALAFAQPTMRVWQARAAATPAAANVANEGDRRVALIIDASASMSRVVAGRTLFERAVDEASAMIESGGANVAWSVVLAADPPRALLPEPTRAKATLLRRLGEASVSGRYASLAEAYRIAGRLLSHGEAAAAELHIWTDGQRTAMRGLGEGQALPDGTRFVPHTVGPSEGAANVAVTAMRVQPGRPIVGRSAAITVNLRNFADEATETTVRLRGVGGGGERTVQLSANGGATLRFNVQLESDAATIATAEIDDDGWAIDDRMSVALIGREAVDVALLSAGAMDDPSTAAFYVARAASPGPRSRFAVRTMRGNVIGASVRPEVVVSVDPPALSDAQRATLARWVRAGTGVVQFGQAVVPAGVGPLAVSGPVEVDGPTTLTPIDVHRAPWAAFEGEPLSTLLAVEFAEPLEARLQPGARLVGRWADGGAAMAEAPVGRGRTMHWAVELNGGSALFRSPVFVPLVQEMLAMARPTIPPIVEARPGERLRQPLAASDRFAELTLTAPHDKTIDVAVVRDEHGRVVGEATLPTGPDALGLYAWRDGGGRLIGGVNALLDRRESDLQSGSVPVPGRGDPLVGPGVEDRSTAGAPTTGRWVRRPLWRWCVAAAAGVLCIELALARWIGAASSGKPLQSDPATTGSGPTARRSAA